MNIASQSAVEHRFQIRACSRLLYVGNLASRRLQELFQLCGSLFAELGNGSPVQLLIYLCLVDALPHISSLFRGAV